MARTHLRLDYTQNSVVEHIVHVLFLPGLHNCDRDRQHARSSSTDSLLYSHVAGGTLSLTSQSSVHLNWPLGSTITRGWSPFHFRLRLTTRLTFNDAGRVVHHRDLIDVKDLIQGFPGGTAFQWIASTFAAQSLSILSRFFVDRPKKPDTNDDTSSTYETSAVPSLKYPIRPLYPSSARSSARAPDVDLA